MKHRLIGAVAAMTMAASGQAWAQIPPPGPQQAQWAPATPYLLNAPTPRDAYRDGLLNRWELERLVGPQPQALQGPSVDGNRGDNGGGGKE